MAKKLLIQIPFLIVFIICMYLFIKPANSDPGFVVENNSLTPEVYFCPAADCMGVLINLTKEASSVDCAFYDLDLVPLIQMFESANAELRLMIDHKNYNDNKELLAALAGKIRLGDPNIQMHNKFCIFDNNIVATGSFNPTKRGNYRNNNNLMIVYSGYLAENYQDEFNELWDGVYSDGDEVRYPGILLNNMMIENYFCPEDCSPEIFTNLIDNARESVYFMCFSFTHDDIGDALMRAHERGIVVKGVFEKSQNNKWNEYEKLKNAGVDVHWDANKANMHHKVFVIDEKTVITGSTNPSNNGLNVNDENILVLHDEDVAAVFLDEFERIYARAS